MLPTRMLRLLLALSLGVSLCAAAPKVEIRIVQRPQLEPPTPQLGPFPFRPPADPNGPFSAYVDSVGCMANIPAEIGGHSVLIDLCHLKNVTFVNAPTAVSKPVETTGEPSLSAASDVEAPKTEPVSLGETVAEGLEIDATKGNNALSRRQIMGIFRGWKIDPIYKKFKYAEFDDGDICGEHGNERYSVLVELVRSDQSDAAPRVYDFHQLSTCQFALRVEAYVPEYEILASSGIHTPGVVDISDAGEMLPQICGELKCEYGHVAGRIDKVKEEIAALQKSLSDMVSASSTPVLAISASTASSIIKSASDALEKALQMLQSIHQLEQTAQNARSKAAAASTVTTGSETQTSDITATS